MEAGDSFLLPLLLENTPSYERIWKRQSKIEQRQRELKLHRFDIKLLLPSSVQRKNLNPCSLKEKEKEGEEVVTIFKLFFSELFRTYEQIMMPVLFPVTIYSRISGRCSSILILLSMILKSNESLAFPPHRVKQLPWTASLHFHKRVADLLSL